jgi:hypothetical protein
MARNMLRALVAAVAAAAVLVAAGCGSQEASVLAPAFEKKITSANVSMSLAANAMGQGLKVTLNGPVASNGDDQIPDADLKLHVEGAGVPAPVDARLVSTAKNAWVQYDGETYVVGEDKIDQLKQQGSSQQQPSPADLQDFLRKAKDWFPDTATQEDATLDGEKVTRVTGRLDLSKAIQGIGSIAKGQQGLPSGAELDQIEGFLADPRFTVDVAKSDGTLRRIAATMDLKGVPGGGKVDFELKLSDVGKPVTVTPLSGGRPIEELGQKLKGLMGAAPALAVS